MMRRFNIAARVWLSVGIFAVGYVSSLVVGQLERMQSERRLATVSQGILPAEQASRDARDSLGQMVGYFNSAIVMHDGEGLKRGADAGGRVIESLQRLSQAARSTSDQGAEVPHLISSMSDLLGDAKRVYGDALANSEGGTGGARTLRDLGARTAEMKRALDDYNSRLSTDLRYQLAAIQDRSKQVRRLLLLIFAFTFLMSGMLVHLTIRRVVVLPLLKAKAALAREQDLLRVLLDNIPDFIYFKDVQSRFIRINKAQADLLGVDSPEQARGRTDFDYFSPEHARLAFADEREIVATGEPVVSKIELISRPGLARWVTSTKVPVKNDRGEVTLIVGVSRDVTAWKEAVDALEESEQSFRLLFDSIPHAVWVYDARTLEFVAFNRAAVHHYGHSAQEFRHLHFSALLPPDEAERFSKLSGQSAAKISGPWRHLTKGGQTLDVEIVAHDLDFGGQRAVLMVAQDVSERNRLQVELQQAQRLEAVGQLAAGIAHEINTPIQYIGDNLRFIQEAFQERNRLLDKYVELRIAAEAGGIEPALLDDLKQVVEDTDLEYLNAEIPKALVQSLDGIERVSSIVRAMKAFAHPGQKQKAAADLNKCLTDALIVARNEIKYVADVETDFGELPPVICRIGDLNQVFLNLLVNAADAIREVNKKTNERGTITVRTRQNADQVVVVIGDTGCGIPANIQTRVFDPFFTTKEVGRGSGQGLAIARNILEKHDGGISFCPNTPHGTIFQVHLPIGQLTSETAEEGGQALMAV